MEAAVHQQRRRAGCHTVRSALGLSQLWNTRLEVINDAFPIQKVIRHGEEIPVESFTPRVLSAHGFCVVSLRLRGF